MKTQGIHMLNTTLTRMSSVQWTKVMLKLATTLNACKQGATHIAHLHFVVWIRELVFLHLIIFSAPFKGRPCAACAVIANASIKGS